MTDWQTKKLGDIATIKRGGSPRPIQDYLIGNDQEGYSWLKIGDVPLGSRYIYKTSSKIKPEGLSKTTLVKKGEFILSNSMSFGRPYIMMTDACIHDGWLALQDITDDTDKQFLYYLLTSEHMQNKFKNFSAGSGVLNLKKETVQAITFNAPEKPEQERIVGVLEVWDEYIEKLEQKIALKEQLKKGLMQQLLTGKRRLPGFNDEWQEFRLHELTKSSSLRNRDLFVDRVLSVTNKRGFVLPSDHFSKVVASDNLSNYKIVKKGEFAYNPSRINVGSIDLLTSYDAGVLSPMYVVFKTTKDLDSEFLKYWLQTARAKANIENAGSGSVRQSVDFKDFGSMKIVIPSVEEQRSIVSALNVIRLQIEQITKLKDLVKLQKKYLLRNLITGAIRTPEDLQPLDSSRLERSTL